MIDKKYTVHLFDLFCSTGRVFYRPRRVFHKPQCDCSFRFLCRKRCHVHPCHSTEGQVKFCNIVPVSTKDTCLWPCTQCMTSLSDLCACKEQWICNNNNNNNNNNHIKRHNSRFLTISSLRREPSPTCTLKWRRRNRVQIMCITSAAYHKRHACSVPLGTKGQLSY